MKVVITFKLAQAKILRQRQRQFQWIHLTKQLSSRGPCLIDAIVLYMQTHNHLIAHAHILHRHPLWASKSHLTDELSKGHFVIPLNLHNSDTFIISLIFQSTPGQQVFLLPTSISVTDFVQLILTMTRTMFASALFSVPCSADVGNYWRPTSPLFATQSQICPAWQRPKGKMHSRIIQTQVIPTIHDDWTAVL